MDKDDINWVANEKNKALVVQLFHENVRSQTTMCTKLGDSSQIQNDALLHREV